jgi:Flp pilus assembly pilin Flp
LEISRFCRSFTTFARQTQPRPYPALPKERFPMPRQQLNQKPPPLLRRFWRGEDGAVSVDFVVLTGAAIALVTSFFAAFSPQITAFVAAIFAGL